MNNVTPGALLASTVVSLHWITAPAGIMSEKSKLLWFLSKLNINSAKVSHMPGSVYYDILSGQLKVTTDGTNWVTIT